MKKLLYISIFIIGSSFSFGQVNLVPNGSFEDYNTCPNAGSENIESSMNWYNPTSYSPDYFNACATDTTYGQSVPNNGFGYQDARTGVAYAGLITMIETDAREYIQIALTDSLTAGVSYTVTFYVSPADSSPYASNNIGAYFSDTPISSGNLWNLPYTPQISNDFITNPIDDRAGWTEVSGVFIAQGGEQYMTIGNFNDDMNTDTTVYINGSNWLSFSYHYIDDVSVIDSTLGIEENAIQSNTLVYPNPSNGNIQINSTHLIEELVIYSFEGQMVFKQYPNSQDIKLDLSTMKEGIYFFKIHTENSTVTKRIIINH